MAVPARTAPRSRPRRSQPAEDGHARRARRTSEQILAAAQAVFAARGYRGARIDDIARRARVAPSSVYNHFGSKEGLLRALGATALARHERYVAAAWALDASPLERLIAAAGATLRFSAEQPVLFRAMAITYLDPPDEPDPVAQAISERMLLQRARLTRVLEQAVEAGELRAVEAGRLAEFLLGAWTGVILMGMRADGAVESRGALAAALPALVAGVAGPAALGASGRVRPRYLRQIERALTCA